MGESLIYVNIQDLCYRSTYSTLGLETYTENQFLEVYYNKTWLIQHFYCSTVIGAVTSCANYLSKFVTTTMQLSLRYWKVYTFHVYACILKDSKWQKVKTFFHHLDHCIYKYLSQSRSHFICQSSSNNHHIRLTLPKATVWRMVSMM